MTQDKKQKEDLIRVLAERGLKELVIPPVTEWTLIQCDVNKDIQIDEKAQITLPDIQLKYADRVFREYVKIIQGKAYCRMEESLKLNESLPAALNKIRFPLVSLEKRIEDLERLAINEFRPNLGIKHANEKGEES